MPLYSPSANPEEEEGGYYDESKGGGEEKDGSCGEEGGEMIAAHLSKTHTEQEILQKILGMSKEEKKRSRALR